jgi:hypothetical protein
MRKNKKEKEMISFEKVYNTNIYCNKENTDITIVTHDENLKKKLSKLLNMNFNTDNCCYCVNKKLVKFILPDYYNMFLGGKIYDLDEINYNKNKIISFDNLFDKYKFILEINRSSCTFSEFILMTDEDLNIYYIPKEWLKIIII